MAYTFITGAVRAGVEELPSGRQVPVQSFADGLNATVDGLRANGHTDIQVDWKPLPNGRIGALVSWNETPAAPLTYKIAEFARRTGAAESTVRDRVRRGEIQAVHVGRRALIPVAELDRFLGSS